MHPKPLFEIIFGALLVIALIAASAGAVQAGTQAPAGSNYTLWWWSPVVGGGTGTGGGYSMSGTIGICDGATLTAGGYSLQGNIWPGEAIPQKVFIPALSR